MKGLKFFGIGFIISLTVLSCNTKNETKKSERIEQNAHYIEKAKKLDRTSFYGVVAAYVILNLVLIMRAAN